jgi:hypothetical protein
VGSGIWEALIEGREEEEEEEELGEEKKGILDRLMKRGGGDGRGY